MNARIYEGIRYIAGKRNVTRDEFHSANGYGAAMLLDGLIGNGYAVQKDGRLALSESGKRALGEVERSGRQ